MEVSDEEVALLLWGWLEIHNEENKRDRSIWVHPMLKKRIDENSLTNYISELKGYPEKFANFVRLSVDTFHYILSNVEDIIRKRNTNYRKSITPEERLFITLRYLATAEMFKSYHYYFRVGETTIGLIVMETCQAIIERLRPVYMSQPTTERWEHIAQRFEYVWNYPNCIGAVDGKHIRLLCPENEESAYFNYKKFHSIILQAVVDADACFVIIDVGDYGRNNDVSVFHNSTFAKDLMEKKLNIPSPRHLLNYENNNKMPFVFVGDEAYPLLVNLMKPFARKYLTNERRVYNYRHSRAHRIVECAFGILSKKFGVFKTCIMLSPDKVQVITETCTILHNLIRKRERMDRSDIFQELLLLEGEETETVDTGRIKPPSHAAFTVRNFLVDYFSSEQGRLPWQDAYAHVQ